MIMIYYILRGKIIHFYGKHHSEETKRKQSEKMKGVNNPNSKLTVNDVIKVRVLLEKENMTQKEIAKIFGVNYMVISRIKNRRNWVHVK